MITVALIVGLLCVFAGVVVILQRQLPNQDEQLVDTIDALLPQTQCAQCGHPGCRPYAEAVAAGAAIDLCPPGGSELVAALTQLMGSDRQTLVLEDPKPMVAVIDEDRCIGCTLCLPPCPVDAIIGAQGFMHTVIDKDCTGCELCIAPCPVDCISLVPAVPAEQPPAKPAVTGQGCINCARCISACPKALQPDQLLRLTHAEDFTQANALSLQDCIECSLCDRVCPSEINLSQQFGYAKQRAQYIDAQLAERERSKQRFTAHQERAEQAQSSAEARRAERLKRLRKAPLEQGQPAEREHQDAAP